MNSINKLAAAIATAVAMGASGVQAQVQEPAVTPAPQQGSSQCHMAITNAELLTCLTAFENEVMAPVTAQLGSFVDVMVQQDQHQPSSTLTCRLKDELMQVVNNDLPTLVTDLSAAAQAENINRVHTLFSATAGCVDMVASHIENEASISVVPGSREKTEALRQAALRGRALAAELKP